MVIFVSFVIFVVFSPFQVTRRSGFSTHDALDCE